MSTMQARIIHITIDRDWHDVAKYVLNPENMPHWAAGLGAGLDKRGDHWVADGGPLGEVQVRFAPDNDLGVADHEVTLPDGKKFHNALRVVPNGDGAEVMFTLLRAPGMSDADFESDADHIDKDLKTLKSLIEKAA
ncbi:SRPBCC family protein [Rhizobium sp. TH2]|uniref:SRPBCC family protein n=1 Tax=Rhizobium sp. TH2 TaxID=2775403 RepID=UPI0021587058|nr:SRPBCC family protein [Rhizobium sp. TH2]UVC11555.1 SRPBCC family protein [Rhizobium sp. TH2]